jgi:TctA family transporter
MYQLVGGESSSMTNFGMELARRGKAGEAFSVGAREWLRSHLL